MFTRVTLLLVTAFFAPLSLHAVVSLPRAPDPSANWQTIVHQRTLEFGHRNWIAIVDSAYPAQTSPGIETLLTGDDHLAVVRTVLNSVALNKHVRPIVYLDAELSYVPAADAPGIAEFRAQLDKTLADREVKRLPHGEIIEALDAAGQKFRVLVLKTNLKLPYTSVFIELDCGYWSADAEARLREAIASQPD